MKPSLIIASRFRSLFGRLRAICRRWRYAIACVSVYLSILLAFAYVYSRLPGGSFYHANVSREPMVRNDKERISRSLQTEIIETFKKGHHGDTLMWCGRWKIEANSLEVLLLEARDKETDVEIRFKLAAELLDISNSNGSIFFVDSTVIFSANESKEILSEGRKAVSKTATVDVPGPPSVGDWDTHKNPSLAEVLFPTGIAPTAQDRECGGLENSPVSSRVVTIPIPERLNHEIRNLAKGVQGDPSNLDGQFWRMLYLSAVTITTVGYGDISPLTTRARVLISVEAVIGIIVIGLFINAVFQQRTMGSTSESSHVPHERQPKQ